MKLAVSPCNQSGARLLFALALLIITYMALTPAPGTLQASVNDKLGHSLAFLLLAFLSHASWPNRDFSWRFALPLLGYGLLIEIAQYFIPQRFFSWLDLLADAGGIVFYMLLLWLLARQPNTLIHSRKHSIRTP